jgi:hypothetical protein
MPLLQGDRWANRAALAVMKSGVDVTALQGLNGAKSAADFIGMLDIASVVSVVLKALGGVDEQVAQELLDELMSVIKVKLPDGSGTRALVIHSDITSISTLWKLRIEAIKVNLDFLKAGVTL